MRKFLAALATAFFTFLPISALAHDEIQSSSPAAESVVEAGAFDVSVTFEENVMDSPDRAGLVIQVTDPAGKTVSNGCVNVSGATLSTPVDLDAAGAYQVAWRSIGSDGHAVEGDFTFTVQNPNGYQSSGVPAVSAECAASQASGEANDNTALIGLAIAIGLVVIGSVAGALRFAREPKPKG